MTKVYVFKTKIDHYGFLTKLAAEKYNIDALSLKIGRNSHGKPYFESLHNFYFNVSHSDDLTVIAVSDQNIGIDAEKLRTPNLKVAKRFCEDEYAYINKNPSPTAFFEIWTKKEAYLKYTGEGLHGRLNSFSVFKTDIPIKTFKKGDYVISVCGTKDFEIIE